MLLRTGVIGALLALPLLLWSLPVSWFVVLLPVGIALIIALVRYPSASPIEATNIARNFRLSFGGLIFLSVLATGGFMLLHVHDGFWLAVILGGATAIATLLPLVILNNQLKNLSRLIHGENLLAHWHIDPDHWHNFAEHDYQQRRKEALERAGIGGIIMAIGIIGFIIYRSYRGEMASGAGLIIELGIYGILAAAFVGAMLYPRWRRYRFLQGPKEVWIGLHGVCIGQQAYWWGKGRFFEAQPYALELQHLDHQQPYINLRYFIKEYRGQHAPARKTAHQQLIPVQKDCATQAQSIIKKISSSLKIS